VIKVFFVPIRSTHAAVPAGPADGQLASTLQAIELRPGVVGGGENGCINIFENGLMAFGLPFRIGQCMEMKGTP
jgi:hypothetical protein